MGASLVESLSKVKGKAGPSFEHCSARAPYHIIHSTMHPETLHPKPFRIIEASIYIYIYIFIYLFIYLEPRGLPNFRPLVSTLKLYTTTTESAQSEVYQTDSAHLGSSQTQTQARSIFWQPAQLLCSGIRCRLHRQGRLPCSMMLYGFMKWVNQV